MAVIVHYFLLCDYLTVYDRLIKFTFKEIIFAVPNRLTTPNLGLLAAGTLILFAALLVFTAVAIPIARKLHTQGTEY